MCFPLPWIIKFNLMWFTVKAHKKFPVSRLKKQMTAVLYLHWGNPWKKQTPSSYCFSFWPPPQKKETFRAVCGRIKSGTAGSREEVLVNIELCRSVEEKQSCLVDGEILSWPAELKLQGLRFTVARLHVWGGGVTLYRADRPCSVP